jgi:hypothetical protein
LGTSPKGRGKAACGGKQSDKLKFEKGVKERRR